MYTFKKPDPVRIKLGDSSIEVLSDGTITFTGGGFVFDGSEGTAGQLLTSHGDGVTPTWEDPATSGTTTGSGTTGKIPKWTSSSALGDSIMSESSGIIALGGNLDITGQAVNVFRIGRSLTTPAFHVDTNAGSSTTGLKILSAANGGGVFLSTLSGQSNEHIFLNAKGTGNVDINGTATGLLLVGHGIRTSDIGIGVTGNPGSAPALTTNIGATINIAAGSNSGGNDTIASVDFYRSSTFIGAVGFDGAASGTIAGHTKAKTDLWFIGQSGTYDIVISNDSKVWMKSALAIGAGLTITSAIMITTLTTFTNGAAGNLGTLTNSPAVGDPTKWIPVNDNGTTRYIPAW